MRTIDVTVWRLADPVWIIPCRRSECWQVLCSHKNVSVNGRHDGQRRYSCTIATNRISITAAIIPILTMATYFAHFYDFAGCNTAIYQDCSLPSRVTTKMTSQGFSHDTNVEHENENECVLRTIESSHNCEQLRRSSQRILAALAASLPIFERSPAPSPPPSEERNAFQEEQKTKMELPRHENVGPTESSRAKYAWHKVTDSSAA